MHLNIVRKGEKEILKRNVCGEMEYLTFPLFDKEKGIKHMFSTRLGGVSEGIYATMNVSHTRGDDPEKVMENYRRIGMVFGKEPKDFVCSHQTHTTNVKCVTREDMGKGVIKAKDYTDVDGLITNEPGIILTTFYADCVPLFFYDPVKNVIGLSHSGWRGTVASMGLVTVQEMTRQYGCSPKDILAGIGPSICQDCYEVSEDVAVAFKERFQDKTVQNKLLVNKGNGKYQLDLWACNKEILLEAGLREEHIQITDICTSCNPDYLFSHRKTNGQRGNLGGFMMLI